MHNKQIYKLLESQLDSKEDKETLKDILTNNSQGINNKLANIMSLIAKSGNVSMVRKVVNLKRYY